MKKRKTNTNDHTAIPHPDNNSFAYGPESFEDVTDLIGFNSNGMTDNEHIDEFNYFNNYLSEHSEK